MENNQVINGSERGAHIEKAATSRAWVKSYFIAPENGRRCAGELRCAGVVSSVSHIIQRYRFARNEEIDLAIIGPEAPLVEEKWWAFRAAPKSKCNGPAAMPRIEIGICREISGPRQILRRNANYAGKSANKHIAS